MGSITFAAGTFSDHLHEVIGYKAGIAVSVEEMCDLVSEYGHSDTILRSEKNGLRIRSEDYDQLYYDVLHKIGATDRPYQGIFEIFELARKFTELKGDEFSQGVFDIYHRHIAIQMELAKNNNAQSLDPTNMINEAYAKYGVSGAEAILKIVSENDRLMKLSPHGRQRWREWGNVLDLSDLFSKYQPSVTYGSFFDQRFIDFLSVNYKKIGVIHWRKFEELVCECFEKFGYEVELGPGSNDDGVDVRVWSEKSEDPKYIIQCKRQKSKIDKVTIKGLYADVLEEGADMGLLVTTSEFSPGARKTVDVRGYPVEEVNSSKIRAWLSSLRTPGTGIVRI
ncbi:restriction endonuclease [Neptuniibacter sp. QD48_55]|uniref:restriction endonuclease n=1 Tax=Neptuniibacter sp. QD48_55 TaxID=3398212 RepID=UPI0039F595D4